MKRVLVFVALVALTCLAYHIESATIAAKQRHVIYDEMWWFVG
jgi:hypothetical protein